MRSSRTPLDLPNFNLKYQKNGFCVNVAITVAGLTIGMEGGWGVVGTNRGSIGINRGPIGEKTEKPDFLPKTNILLHMAIQAVLA